MDFEFYTWNPFEEDCVVLRRTGDDPEAAAPAIDTSGFVKGKIRGYTNWGLPIEISALKDPTLAPGDDTCHIDVGNFQGQRKYPVKTDTVFRYLTVWFDDGKNKLAAESEQMAYVITLVSPEDGESCMQYFSLDPEAIQRAMATFRETHKGDDLKCYKRPMKTMLMEQSPEKCTEFRCAYKMRGEEVVDHFITQTPPLSNRDTIDGTSCICVKTEYGLYRFSAPIEPDTRYEDGLMNA